MTYPAGILAAKLQAVWDLALVAPPLGATLSAPGQSALINSSGAVEHFGQTLDAKGVLPALGAAIRNGPGGSMRLVDCSLENSPRSLLFHVGDSLDLIGCYLGAAGLAPAPNDHLQQVFLHTGAAVISRCFFDGRACKGPFTGLLFAKTDQGAPVTAHISGSVFAGAADIGIPYALQATAKLAPVTLAFSGCAVGRGTHAYAAWIDGPAPLRVIDAGGNVDLDTGQPIDLSHPKV